MHLRFCILSIAEAFITKSDKEYIDKLKPESDHPKHIMKAMGITYKHSTPQSIGDQWWFWNCENVPEKLPGFLSVLNVNPLDCIGYGLSEEEAFKIRNGN